EAFGGSFDASAAQAGRGTRVTARFAWDSLFAVPAAGRRASHS
ncbi:sensor histidine kinase, partial [Burkholderia territorii]